MKKRYTWILAVLSILVAVAAVPTERYFDVAKSLDVFATLFKEVNAQYVDEVSPEKMVNDAIEGMLQNLDPYTDYIPEEELESFRITTTGQYAGIGALIGVVNNRTVITQPYKGFPAFRAGLHVGDEIIAVDGKNVEGKSTADISALLKGQAKSSVEIKVRRYAHQEPLTFTVRREKISLSNLAYTGMLSQDIGYIKLDDFTPGAANEVEESIKSLKAQGARKIVLDLRDNPGGLLHEAVNIVNLFIPKGKEVVATRGKVKDWNKRYTTLNSPLDTTIPLVVVTGEGSASASEIVAGALQDYDRAVLVGSKTFGKGLVQTTRPLPYGAQLKITTARYYIPSGRCIQALDYAHRKEDGTVDKFADSLKREFKTAAGRSVYDGAGLDPDVAVSSDYVGTITAALITSGLLFEYASRYSNEHPLKGELRDFRLSKADYDAFTTWLAGQKFTYSTQLETNMQELVNTARKENLYTSIEPQLNALKEKIEKNKAADLIRFQDEITEALTRQIAFHYQLSEGLAIVSIPRDATIQKAIAVLNDPATFKKILSVQ